MFDKVETPITAATPFSAAIEEIRDELRAERPAIPFRRSADFSAVVDLREITGHDAFLHLQGRHNGNHKLELLNCGEKTLTQMESTIADVVRIHPEMLPLGRVDACANVEGVSVPWFARSVRAQCKQWQAQIGYVELEDSDGRRMQFSEMGKRCLQTMYMGKRPNCVRIYDKRAEMEHRYDYERRRHERAASTLIAERCCGPESPGSPGLPLPDFAQMSRDWQRGLSRRLVGAGRNLMPFPTFESWFAEHCIGGMSGAIRGLFPEPEQLKIVPEIPRVLTRVERQMGAGRVPDQIGTVEKLRTCGLDFNPFAKLQFVPAEGDTEVFKHEFTPLEWLAGLKMRELLSSGEMSYQQLYAFLNQSRNAPRIIEKFRVFLATAQSERTRSITPAELYESYRDTVSRQLAA